MCEARVATDAIGSLPMYIDRRCVAALGNKLSTNILRRYAASILIIFRTPWVTAATRASPKAKIPIALRAYLWI